MKMKKTGMILVAAMLAGVCSVQAGYGEKVVHKLGRGVANVVSCPIEVLLNVESVAKDRGYIAGGTYGVIRGVYRGVIRGVVGACEIISFLIPQEPVVHPEFVMDPTSSDEYEWNL